MPQNYLIFCTQHIQVVCYIMKQRLKLSVVMDVHSSLDLCFCCTTTALCNPISYLLSTPITISAAIHLICVCFIRFCSPDHSDISFNTEKLVERNYLTTISISRSSSTMFGKEHRNNHVPKQEGLSACLTAKWQVNRNDLLSCK